MESTPRQRMQALFDGRPMAGNVVGLHTWGLYPFAHYGLEGIWCRSGGEALADVHRRFAAEFQLDWIHTKQEYTPRSERLSSGVWREVGYPRWGAPAVEPPYPNLKDFTHLDAYYDAVPWQHIRERGDFDHVEILRRDPVDRMVFPNECDHGSGAFHSGFDDQMVAALEEPDAILSNLYRHCRTYGFAVQKALKASGGDGFIFSMGYGGAMDLVSPAITRRMNVPAWQEFFTQMKRIGVKPIGYCLGGIVPYLDLIREMGPAGVMPEESKKSFTLDVVELRQKLPPDIMLFGNLDSQLLWRGTFKEIEAEVKRQAHARDYGPFAFMNGSPICPDTPTDNLKAFIDAARCA